MEQSFFEILLQLPLFQGLGHKDLTDIVSKVQFDFQKKEVGTAIVRQDTKCNGLMFLLKGDLDITRTSHKLFFSESLHAPDVIGIDSLFGLSQIYRHTLTARSDVQLLLIDKRFVINKLLLYEVFRFNLLNILSTRIQRATNMLCEEPATNLPLRFIQFLKHNFIRHAGEKVIEGRMIDIAPHFGETRLTLSRMLNKMEEMELIKLRRKQIIIPAFENLILQSNKLQ